VTNETDSFVNEVDESLRQDRVLGLVRRYGPYAAGAFAALLVGILIWQGWSAYQRGVARGHSEAYLAAQELVRAGNLDAAKTEFERLSNTGPSSYRALAQMERAALLEQEGDLAAALAAFDEAAERSSDPVMRQSAQMRAAYLAAETEDFTRLRARLAPLTDDSSRFAYLARELLGVEAWKAGDLALARETLQGLTLAFDAPEAVRQRAQLALAVIGPAPEAAEGADAPAPSEGESK